MITVALDASTYAGTVCVARDRELVTSKTVAMRDRHSERLMPAVAAALAESGVAVGDVDRIVCGAGPGSFTGLRIAAAIAKGIATATGVPVYAVSSLALMAAAVEPPLAPGEYLTVLDALRGEAFAATCVVGLAGVVTAVTAVALATEEELASAEGSGKPLIGAERRIPGAPHARGVVRVEELLERGGPVDLRRWEPDYGRVAEAQRRWEAAHGRALSDA